MEIGTLKSLNPSKYSDIHLTLSKVTLGRNPKCDITLSDIRCSGIHCSITPKQTNDWEFLIEDFSSNGTYLNGILIGKNQQKIATWNDKLEILKESKNIDSNLAIAFVFIETVKRKNNDPVVDKIEKIQKVQDNYVEDEITCSICFEIMLKPLTLCPCLHTFCEPCYLDWKNKSTECPQCRGPVTEVLQSNMIQGVIDIYLQQYPDKKKVIEKCMQCDKKIKDFQCPPNQKHINCKSCNILMPDRKDPLQHCKICHNFYCCLYFSNCPSGLDTLKNYWSQELHPKPGCLKNKFEETVLEDYLTKNKSTGVVICDNLYKEGNFTYSIDTVICEECIENIYQELIFKFRESIQDKLPEFIQNRNMCAKGRACKLQGSILHSQIYNHF